jgi:hypothetical protein
MSRRACCQSHNINEALITQVSEEDHRNWLINRQTIDSKLADILPYSSHEVLFLPCVAPLPSLGPFSRRVIFIPDGRFGGGLTRNRIRISLTTA